MEIGYHEDIPVYDVLIPNENWTLAYLLRDTLDTNENVESVACDMVHPTSETNTVKLQIRLTRADLKGIREHIKDACKSVKKSNNQFAQECLKTIG